MQEMFAIIHSYQKKNRESETCITPICPIIVYGEWNLVSYFEGGTQAESVWE